MIVTGVQAVGAKGVNSVQVAAVDPKEAARILAPDDGEHRPEGSFLRRSEQPVVFPREGVPLDRRPVDLRREHAVARYRDDGNPPEEDERRSA